GRPAAGVQRAPQPGAPHRPSLRRSTPVTTLELSPEDGTLLLSGIVGSVAYGLAGPDSDVDRLGVYAAPTTAFHGLHPPVGKAASKATTSPDCTLHEAGKFAALLLGGNPTITELLWLPDDLYEVRTPLG